MTFLYMLPPIISFLLIGAHFMRAGYYPLVLASVLAAGLIFLRTAGARVILQIALTLVAAEWIRVTIELVGERQFLGMPFFRTVIILGAVAAFSLLSAVLLNSKRMKRWFGPQSEASAVTAAADAAAV